MRAVIGKGGMGAKTLQGLKESGAVYLNAVGGAAQFYARCIERTDGVSLMEFGTPEAMWHLWVRDFPAIVTMDAHGNSLHKDLEAESGEKLQRCLTVGVQRLDGVEIEELRPRGNRGSSPLDRDRCSPRSSIASRGNGVGAVHVDDFRVARRIVRRARRAAHGWLTSGAAVTKSSPAFPQ